MTDEEALYQKLTIDERISKLEHVTSAHIQQARKDYEENRRLWREQQTDIAAIWKAMKEGAAESRQLFDDGMKAMREEMAERDKQWDRKMTDLDQRIGTLVSSIGELIRRMDGKK
jgi:hypothetical protein